MPHELRITSLEELRDHIRRFADQYAAQPDPSLEERDDEYHVYLKAEADAAQLVPLFEAIHRAGGKVAQILVEKIITGDFSLFAQALGDCEHLEQFIVDRDSSELEQTLMAPASSRAAMPLLRDALVRLHRLHTLELTIGDYEGDLTAWKIGMAVLQRPNNNLRDLTLVEDGPVGRSTVSNEYLRELSTFLGLCHGLKILMLFPPKADLRDSHVPALRQLAQNVRTLEIDRLDGPLRLALAAALKGNRRLKDLAIYGYSYDPPFFLEEAKHFHEALRYSNSTLLAIRIDPWISEEARETPLDPWLGDPHWALEGLKDLVYGILLFLFLNGREGSPRAKILEGNRTPPTSEDWIKALISTSEVLSGLFYYLQLNPSLCCHRGVRLTSSAGKKRGRVSEDFPDTTKKAR